MGGQAEIITKIMNHKANAIIRKGARKAVEGRDLIRDGTLRRLVLAARAEKAETQRRRGIEETGESEIAGPLRGNTIYGCFPRRKKTPYQRPIVKEEECGEGVCLERPECMCRGCGEQSADVLFEMYIDVSQCGE